MAQRGEGKRMGYFKRVKPTRRFGFFISPSLMARGRKRGNGKVKSKAQGVERS
jgi:hypothetical protein